MKRSETKVVTVTHFFCDVCGNIMDLGYRLTVDPNGPTEQHACGRYWPQKRAGCKDILFARRAIETKEATNEH